MTLTTTYVPPGGGTSYVMIDGTHVAKTAVRDDHATFEVFEVTAHAGAPTPPHVSPWTGVLYVLEGTIAAQVDDESVEAGPGGLVVMPGGSRCGFHVVGERARFLAITSSDRAGRFFADFAATVTPDHPLEAALPAILAVTDRHGVAVIPPTG